MYESHFFPYQTQNILMVWWQWPTKIGAAARRYYIVLCSWPVLQPLGADSSIALCHQNYPLAELKQTYAAHHHGTIELFRPWSSTRYLNLKNIYETILRVDDQPFLLAFSANLFRVFSLRIGCINYILKLIWFRVLTTYHGFDYDYDLAAFGTSWVWS